MRQQILAGNETEKPLSVIVEVYCTASCPYCRLARKFLQQRRITYIEFLVEPGDLQQLQIGGDTQRITVPQIFIGGYYVGGYEDLKQWYNSGRLAALLKPAPSDD